MAEKPSARRKREEPLANVPAEKALLGCIIRNPQSFWDIMDTVRTDQFSVPFHRDLFAYASEVILSGHKLTMAGITTKFPEDMEDGQSMIAYVAALTHNAEGLNALDFCDAVAETASRRQLIAISEAIEKAARKGDLPAVDVAGEAETAILDVMRVSATRRPQLIEVTSRAVVNAAGSGSDGQGIGLLTGLEPLDAILGRILPGDSGYLIASQADGKTAMAQQIAMHAALTTPVLFVEQEMSDEQLAARELAKQSGVSLQRITEGWANQAEFDDLEAAHQKISQHKLWILDVPEITIKQMRSHAIGMIRTCGLGLIVIDQLDKLKADGFYKDRFERATSVTRGIKVMAKDLKVPIITLAQRTRSSQRRDDATPDVLDTDYPSIERDADWIIGLWRLATWLQRHRPAADAPEDERDEWERKFQQAQNRADIICLKRRRGVPFEKRALHWDGPRTRFSAPI